MDFNYSEEQRMLAESLRRFIDNDYGLERRRQASPVTPSAVMAPAILQAHGSLTQAEEWLEAMAQGRSIVSIAYLEAHSRFDPSAVRTRARRVDGGFVLDGRKCLAWHGERADALIVSAVLEDTEGLTLFMVPTRETTGLTVTGYPTMDGHRAADVALAGVVLGPDAVIGLPGRGLEALQFGLDHGTAALCAEAAGAMEKVIELTGEYLRTRQQFGVPLGSFQALQHRMADMLVQKELALSMAFVAVQALDEADPAQRQRMLAAAKHTAAKAGRFIGQQAVQLHGGMGVTDEMAVGDYFKRLTMIDPLLGDADWQLDRFAAVQAF